MKNLMIYLFGFALLIPFQARAGMTAIQMLDVCLSKDSSVCDMYLIGIADEHDFLSLIAEKNKLYIDQFGICLDKPEFLNKQMLMIVKNYMRNNPEKLNDDMTVIFHKAMHEKFPCKE